MNRKTIAAITAIALIAGLAACGGTPSTGADTKTPDTSSTQKAEPQPQPADLTGTWKQTNSNSDDSWMEATVTADTIQVDWVTADTKSLYWVGTFEAPTEAGDWSWTSQGDTEAMSTALMASQDATKDFNYSEADGISFDVTMMGTTMTVKTSKQ